MLTPNTIVALCGVVKSLTLQEALEALRRVNQSHLETRMYVETQMGNCQELQFKDLGDDARNLRAHLTSFWKMWFECGPPGNRNWVEGTICQYVADCLLLEVTECGEKTISDIVSDVIKVGTP